MLTPEYLQFFKKSTSKISEMGNFIFKVVLEVIRKSTRKLPHSISASHSRKRGTLMMENLTLSEFQKVKKSKFGWNFNIMDGLGWILKIFKQNHQKRPEAKVNLRNNDQRLEQPPVVQMAWKLCHYGWFGRDFENIQADPSKEARGQS